MFAEREGYCRSSDAGASFHYNLPSNYGDVHVGVYNGENYNRAEVNDQKALADARHGAAASRSGTPRAARPARARLLRRRQLREGRRAPTRRSSARDLRAHVLNAGVRISRHRRPDVGDQPAKSTAAATRSGRPRATPTRAGKALLRYDHMTPDHALPTTSRERGPSSASPTGFRTRAPCRPRCCSTTTARPSTTSRRRCPTQKRIAVHALVNF